MAKKLDAICRKIRTRLAAELRATKPLRGYDRGQEHDRYKAIEYARWLAHRDGIQVSIRPCDRWSFLAETETTRVDFVPVYLETYKGAILRAASVTFDNGVTIEIPHTFYDHTAMPGEQIEDETTDLFAAPVEPVEAVTEPVDLFAASMAAVKRHVARYALPILVAPALLAIVPAQALETSHNAPASLSDARPVCSVASGSIDPDTHPVLPVRPAMSTFTWTTEQDHTAPNGKRYVLRNPAFPKGSLSSLCCDDRIAACSYWGARRWVATFWTGYDSIETKGGTAASAIRRLEAILARRSIGLIGEDNITFTRAEHADAT